MRKFRTRKSISLLMAATMVVGNLGTGVPLTVNAAEDSKGETSSMKFNFGTDKLDGYTNVNSKTVYDEDLGYGFSTSEYTAAADGWVGGIYYPRTVVFTDSNSSYITDDTSYISVASKVWKETESTGYGVYTYENTSTFDIKLKSADYTVTVELTNPTDTDITVNLEAEDITKKTGVVVKAHESTTATFTACLVDGRLNLKFLADSSATEEESASVKNVYVSKVEVEQITREKGDKPTVFIASDSTVQTYDDNYYPQTGWGQVLYNFFNGGDNVNEYECDDCDYSQAQTYETDSVIVENRAIGGRSSKSFVEEGKLDDLLEDVKPGDYVLVQWGHNDATAARPNRYVSTDDFEDWLQYYVDGVEQRGGTCILVTPVARRSYTTDEDGNVSFKSDFEAYRQIMLKMGEEKNVPVLDLTQASIDVCNKFGEEGSKSLFLWLNAGDYEGAYAGGVSDSTHLQYYGAYKFAQCVAKLIKEYDKDDRLDALKAVTKEITTPETAPKEVVTNLETTTVGASSVSFKWDKTSDAELYYIYKAELTDGQTAEDVDFTNAEKYSVSATNKYTDGKCEGGKTYVYAVAGFNEAGVGEISEKMVVTTKSALYKYDFCQDATNPTMEGYLQVTSTQMYNEKDGYGWLTAPGNGRYRANNGNASSNDMTDDFCLGNGEFAVDLPNGKYEIKVTACDLLSGTSTIKPSYTAEGVSIGTISTKQAAASVSATVIVEDGQLNLTVGGTNPYINGLEITPVSIAPSGLIMQELTFDGDNANFLLQWNDTEDAVSYNVYAKAESDTEYSLVKNVTAEEKANATTLPFTVVAGENYTYYVTAILKDDTETPKSNLVEVDGRNPDDVIPNAPTGVVCDNSETANMQISWEETDNAIKYIIYRSDREEGAKGYKGYTKVAEVKGKSNTTYVDTDADVTANVKWYYKVQAFSTKGGGELSEACETEITDTLVRTKAETLTDRALVAINLAGDDGTGVDENGKEGTNVSSADSGVYLSWRTFENDPEDVTYTLYKNGKELVSGLTVGNYIDVDGTASDTYKVVGSSDEELSLNSESVATWQNKYIEFELDKPEDQTMPDGTTCTYTANDMSVGDLDGDGKYELIVKWYPSNAKDNSGSGYTGTTILDAYDIDVNTGKATKMWRIDLGINIRSGAHYTQFQVWDFDNDGRAEIVCKTADGTVDGEGNVIGDGSKDYRNTSGYILEGPEYLTIFDGETGKAIDTTDYLPERGSVSAWGDAYGNRVDRFLSGVAYLDGENPSMIFARGYYTRTCLTAYDFVDGKLVTRWEFDTDVAGTEYESQGNHQLSINDIDNDGKDEIIYGALVLDHNGTVKYSTGLGHGDAQHISDWTPDNEGLEIFSVHEHSDATYQVEIHDAETGEILYGYYTGVDTGRGVAADVDPTNLGAEFWANAEWNGTDGGMYSASSTFDNVVKLSENTPSVNGTLFWDGDLLSELQDHTFNNSGNNYYPVSSNITKWNAETGESETLFESAELLTNNGTKGNMGLIADILGDWREEIISRTNDESNSKIRIYSTTIETDYKVPCLMENDAYRIGVAWENVGYNQPANLDYLLSEGLVTATLQEVEATYNSLTFNFYGASDGVNGHEIEGYEVYKLNVDTNEYELVGSVAVNDYVVNENGDMVYSFTDSKLNQNTEYSYKVAAVVDNKTSFKSNELTMKTLLSIKEVVALEDLTIVQDTPDYEELIPNTVTVIDANDNIIDDIEVEWNIDNLDITTAGEYVITGTIDGYDKEIELTVIVEENTVVSYESLEDIYSVVGLDVTLPETVKHNMKNGTVKELNVTWNTDVLDVNTIGEYVVKGTSELLDDIEVKVIIKDNYIVSVADISAIEVNKGTVAKLPDTVMATFANGEEKEVNVTWEDVDTSVVGTYVVTGKVSDYAKDVTITVYVVKEAYKKFDFGIDASRVADGWTGVTVNRKGGTSYAGYVYSAEQGYGFTDVGSDELTSPLEGRTEEFTYTGEGVLPYNVYTDFVLPGGKEFKVDLPNGNYSVQIIANSIYASKVSVSIEGSNNVTVANAAGSYTIYTEDSVDITDGQLNLVFPSGIWRLGGVIITRNDDEIEEPSQEVTTDVEETTPSDTEETTTPNESEVETDTSKEESTEETTKEPDSTEDATKEPDSSEDATEDTTQAPADDDNKEDTIIDVIVKVVTKVVNKIISFIKGFGRH